LPLGHIFQALFFTTRSQRFHLSVKSLGRARTKLQAVTLHHSESTDGQQLAGAFSFGPLELHPNEGLASAGGVALHLSVREFELLVELARNDGRIVRREELYEAVWGEPLRPGDRTVDVYVRRLRVKLTKALPAWSFIHTHVGFGYRFAPMRGSAHDTGEPHSAL
jgi:DNA-binding response OmpR family regulator